MIKKTPLLPTHETISKAVDYIVKMNMDNGFEHNRESIDDLIRDLSQYRDELPTCEEYMEKGEL